MRLESYAEGKWYCSQGNAKDLFHAVSGEKIAEITSEGLNFAAMAEYARNIGGKHLRNMTFHERGRMLKSMALYLMERKDELYETSFATGATRRDSWIDIEGGISTFFTYASKGRRELPDEKFYVDGNMEVVSPNGTFVGHHICVPLEGLALHINAFNFPCWGMLEKLAANFLAGVPAIVKPASLTAYLTERMVKIMIESNILPEGALQLICGRTGDLFEHLMEQDVVTFTGSATTGQMLKSHPKIVENSIRFNMEADSLNCCILGSDVTPDLPEFKLFIKEVTREMTVKAGQKCTAIRRVIVPENQVDAVLTALKESLAKTTIGDPTIEGVRMGPLAGADQVEEVTERVATLQKECEIVYGGGEFEVQGDKDKGAFFPPTLLLCKDGFANTSVHDVEAFGPVSTVIPYKSNSDAIELARMGKGSLVGSLFTADDNVAKEIVFGVAPYHGRLVIINNECAKESTGHGSPLPHLVHGGPGRAGGGEEMGGIRGVMHYMQRTAIQGSPTTLSKICNEWLRGAKRTTDRIHPFQKFFDELEIGESFTTHRRTVTEADVVNFAGISGDYFYAHTDDIAAKDSFFEKRVAHGYFVLSAAAGLFVHPAPGPVIANYGLEGLRFTEPVYPGDTIYVKLTCKQKTEKEKREDEKLQGVVHWDVEVFNQEEVMVAVYTILTLVERREKS
ncbi:phenylacetic acid degradation bifunctional protein PaaZ [Candidatus Uabimicrobium sp. HlEnr_7]|uniref:phenylacetic acid degradation bifunctional protein PaaZ n=1 Tax=Candidatus Uabimicrobium helgolandensis TaxID=3095367 RepID=UPI003556EE79